MSDVKLPAVRDVGRDLEAIPKRLLALAAKHAKVVLNAQSAKTRQDYERCWVKYSGWCKEHDIDPMPSRIAALILYVMWLAEDEGYAISSINQAVAAIKDRHSQKRRRPIPTTDEPLADAWKDPALLEVMRALRRTISAKRTVDRAQALTDEDMLDVFDILRPVYPREARDAALFAAGFAGCRRRSELVGLDYVRRGAVDDPKATGVLTIDETGVVITLYRSKTNQEGVEETYRVLAKDAPRCVAAVRAWIAVAGVKPGTPLFRGITGGTTSLKDEAPEKQRVAGTRLTPQSVRLIIQRRMYQVLKRRILTKANRKKLRPEEEEECRRLAKEFSGHSLRRGSITAALDRGIERHHVRAQSGHKPGSAMLDLYASSVETKKNKFLERSGL